MGETKEHSNLVERMFNYVKKNFPYYLVSADIQNRTGDEIPGKIGGYRPDLFAYNEQNGHHIIGEAKTSRDLESRHSIDQIKAFLNYLKTKNNSDFMLSVPYESADRAKVVLSFIHKDLDLKEIKIIVFDQCDWWHFKGQSWDLNHGI